MLAESEHPFTTNLDKNDVRITTKFIEDIPFSSIFSTAHELGHGIYEQQTGDDLVDTLLGGGGSMGLHESQSRFYENIICRSKAFGLISMKMLRNFILDLKIFLWMNFTMKLIR